MLITDKSKIPEGMSLDEYNATALRVIKTGAELGNVEMQCLLAVLYHDGDGVG